MPAEKVLASSAGALGIQFVAQLAIGLYLARNYMADPISAHASVAAMHSGGLDFLLQKLHYWGSAVLILHSLLHIGGSVWFGMYRRPNGRLFYASLLLLLCSLGFQLTGNVLPFDRHGVQTAGIEAGIAARAPVVGGMMSHLLLGGDTFNDGTLAIWYGLHRYALPVLAIFALWLLFGGLKQLSAKPGRIAIWVPLLLTFVLTPPSPLGTGATSADYGAFSAKVSWYMWPLHGTMRAFDGLISGGGWIGAMVVPGLLLAFVFALPLIGERVKPLVVRSVLAGFAVVLLGCGLGFAGSAAPLTGTRDPAADVASSSAPGTTVDKALAAKGLEAFNRLDCASCHGKDAKGSASAPSLLTTWKRHADADYYMKYVRNPSSMRADSTMPAFPVSAVSDADLKAVAEFLRSPK